MKQDRKSAEGQTSRGTYTIAGSLPGMLAKWEEEGANHVR